MAVTVPQDIKFKDNAKFEYYGEVTYQMFPEHAKEFANQKFEPKFNVLLPEDEYTANHFEIEIELPFGTVSAVLKCRNVNSDDQKLEDVTSASINSTFKTFLEPVPISQAD